jgi:hypothetical protein
VKPRFIDAMPQRTHSEIFGAQLTQAEQEL